MIAVEDFLARLQKVKKQRGYWVACCPAHDDHDPSMSVRDHGSDGIGVKCFSTEGACTTADIARAVGIKASDLLPDKESRAKILDTYPYHGSDGELLYEVVRYVPKSFKQRKPDGQGGWEWSLGDTQRVPYRLPELRDGIDKGRWVFLVEGEKDVHRLEGEGLVATTTPQGSANWQDHYADWFAGGLVAIIPDNDPQGEQYAQDAAEAISKVAREVRVVTLSDVKPKGDISDWLYTHTADDLQALVKTAEPWRGGGQVPHVVKDQALIEMTWPGSDVVAKVDRLNWQSGQVHGEVSVFWGGRPLVEFQRVNTQSASARSQLMTELRRYDSDIEWHDILAQLFGEAVRQYRTVGRLVDMREAPPAEPPKFLIGDYWPDMPRPSLLFGDGEAAKSTISLALLLSLASGRSVVGDEAVPARRCPVAFLDYEDDEALFAYRLQQMARAADIDLTKCEPIHYYRPDAALHQIADSLSNQIAKEGVEGIVVDSRSGAQSGSLNNDDDTRTFIDAVLHLGGRSWIIDHLDKESTKKRSPAKHSYGSVFLRNRVVSSWFVRAVHKTRTQANVTLTEAKWNHGPEREARSLVVEWTEGVRIDRKAEPVFESQQQSNLDRIVAWLWEQGPVGTQLEIAEELNMNRGTVSSILNTNPHMFTQGPGGWQVRDEMPDPF